MPEIVPAQIEQELAELIQALTAGAGALERGSIAPLPGGYDTEVFGLTVNGESDLPAQLVLRVFRPTESMRAPIEASAQNWAADAGLPVPRVFAGFSAEHVGGRPFTLMSRAPGNTLLASISDPAVASALPGILASVQHRLHAVGASGLIAALRGSNLASRVIGPADILSETARFAAGPDFSKLLAWLDERVPDPPPHPVVCHGDLHPGNVLAVGTSVTGVIDWGGFLFGSAEADVATTRVIIGCAGRLTEESLWPMLQQVVDSYSEAYQQLTPLNHDLLAWCETLRAAHALGQALTIDPGRRPQGYAWGEPAVFDALSALVRRHTGIEVNRPA